ncbi:MULTISPECIES: hypothetical protein [Actinomadura]|uniref:Uncharacterized protein n=1 Tax=Actinomadura yumaensis TaxID=111807 RepID=A0ABW2CSD2_9ACTN|nr:hypothetical protein [Actinomadura sp. J1-007]
MNDMGYSALPYDHAKTLDAARQELSESERRELDEQTRDSDEH